MLTIGYARGSFNQPETMWVIVPRGDSASLCPITQLKIVAFSPHIFLCVVLQLTGVSYKLNAALLKFRNLLKRSLGLNTIFCPLRSIVPHHVGYRESYDETPRQPEGQACYQFAKLRREQQVSSFFRPTPFHSPRVGNVASV